MILITGLACGPALPAAAADKPLGEARLASSGLGQSGVSPNADAPLDQLSGLDVSAYQGNVDWHAVKDSGASFAYVKASEGLTYLNPYFGQQYDGSADAGLIRGAYHFAQPANSSGTAQADYFVDHGGGWTGDGTTLPPALDIEFNPKPGEDTCYGLSQAAMVTWVQQFSNEMYARTSRYPTIYTNTNWWIQCTGNSGAFGETNPLWISRFGDSPGTLPAGWSTWTFWQYANSGTFPGDQDVFNGSQADLQKLALGDVGPQDLSLENAGFELESQGWVPGAGPDGLNYVTYEGDDAREGLRYMAANTTRAGASIAQTVSTSVLVGRSYQFTVWVRASSPRDGTLALRGFGGSDELAVTDFRANKKWRQVSVTLSPTSAHTSLKAEIYLNDTGPDYYFDATSLSASILENAGFELESQGWVPGAGPDGLNYVTYEGDDAREGLRYMAANTTRAGASIAQTVSTSVLVGRSYQFTVWVRASSPRDGTLALRGFGGSDELAVTDFRANKKWRQVSVTLSPTSAHTSLKAEIYLNDTGPDYYFDATSLSASILENAGFELESQGWVPGAGPDGLNYVTYEGDDAREGLRYMAANTTRAGASIAQTVSTSVLVGRSYQFTVWVRASSPRDGTLALRGFGGSDELAVTDFRANKKWRQVSVTLSPTSAHTSLKAEIYLNDTGRDYYYFDATSLH